MGSGVALAIRNKWPRVYSSYINYIDNFNRANEFIGNKEDLLGQIDWVEVSKDLIVVNLFGQKCYGHEGERYTSYGAWEKALLKIKEFLPEKQIYFPYLCGCALGGGDWRIISAMIEEHFPNAIFCKI